MSNIIKAVRGMNDKLPAETWLWQSVEAILRETARQYGYQEFRTPTVEKTELFKRSIGEVTDIVEKEMYTFLDRNNDSMTLRPEGTASCVRAAIEHGLLYNQIQRFWYMGPMFRYERPQKGRYRQFEQFGIEAFGMAEAAIDAEVILFTARLWQNLGIQDGLELQLNSLGSAAARAVYREQLVAYFEQHFDSLDEDSKRRLGSNPLRILDSKNPAMHELIQKAPKLTDYLDEISAEHFAELQRLLDAAEITYVVNPRLVRGLDYYNSTVFEWVMTHETGAQNTVAAGGRYDSLVEQLGGQPTPAMGFAMGMERVISLLVDKNPPLQPSSCDVYLIMAGASAKPSGIKLAEHLRSILPSLQLLVDCAGGSLKSQFKRADKSGAQFALVLGDDEIDTQTITVKFLREAGSQKKLPISELIALLKDTLLVANKKQ